jgi:hypothetical protein
LRNEEAKTVREKKEDREPESQDLTRQERAREKRREGQGWDAAAPAGWANSDSVPRSQQVTAHRASRTPVLAKLTARGSLPASEMPCIGGPFRNKIAPHDNRLRAGAEE